MCTPITDGAAGKPWVFRYKDLRSWWSKVHYNRPGGVESGTPTAWAPQSKPIRFTELGCPAIDRGTNQPNVFFDPKSSESFTPHFSRGWRDDTIQRAYLEATYLFWGKAANNPLSSVYGGRMVHVPECAAWTWDARPYPFFPELADVWTDGPNWRLGHWLTGRLGAVSLAALVRHLCLRAGLPEDRIDVTGLWGAVEGYAIGALESPRASITTLARHFGFDAVETEGVIRFVMRGRAAVASVSPDDLVAVREGDVLELIRGQETELPQALKWQVARADEDYEAAQVEARRITVDTTRIASESFPMAVSPAPANDANFAFKTNWSARALIALLGSDDFSFKVSPDGSAFYEALRIDRTSGRVEMPEPVVLPAVSAVPVPPPTGKLALYARDRAGGRMARRSAPLRAFLPAAAAFRGEPHRDLGAIHRHDRQHQRHAAHGRRHRLHADARHHEPLDVNAPLARDQRRHRRCRGRGAVGGLGLLARKCGWAGRLHLRKPALARHPASDRHGLLRPLRFDGSASDHLDLVGRGELYRHRLPARHPHELATGPERRLRRADAHRSRGEFPGGEHDERPDPHAPRRPEQQRDRRSGCRGSQRGSGRGHARHRHTRRDATPEPAQLHEQRRDGGGGRLRLLGGICRDGLLRRRASTTSPTALRAPLDRKAVPNLRPDGPS